MTMIPLLAAEAAQSSSIKPGTVVAVAVLIVAILLAVRSALRHFKGEGGCCGGGGTAAPPQEKEMGRILATKTLSISGMHCMHCVSAVTAALNAIDGVSADVDLQLARATVRLDRAVDDAILRAAVEKAGFQVTSIA